MRNPARYRIWLIGWCCCLLLTACVKRDTPQPDAALASPPITARSLDAAIPEAVNRVFQRSCQACHGPDGHGILAVAPDLSKAKSRRPEQWKQFLSSPQGGHPGADLPPPTWLNADEIALLSDYLTNITSANPPVAEPTRPARPVGKRGKAAR